MESMRRNILFTALSIGFCALLIAAGFTTFGYSQAKPAQAAAAPQAQTVMRVLDVQIKPGMSIEWESYLKNELMPSMKQSGLQMLAVFKTAQFGKYDNYFLISPLTGLAQLDTNPLVERLGAYGAASLMAKIQQFVDSSRSYMITGRSDLGIAPPSGYAMKMGVLARTAVAPGRTDDFEKGTKEMMAVIGKTNAKGVLVSKVGLGGNPNEYLTYVLFDSFADLEKFPQAFQKAAAEAKLAEQSAGVAMYAEWSVIVLDPNLSILSSGQ
jgi:hypothetical protein